MKFAYRLSVIAATMLVAGCGGNSRPTPVPFKGKLVYQGAPVTNAQVQFFPEKAPSPASGDTGPNGEFILTTYAPNDGVLPGKHKVIVTVKSAAGAPGATSVDGADYAAAMAALQTNPNKEPPKPPFPAKYMDLLGSDLSVEVKEGEPQDVTLELHD